MLRCTGLQSDQFRCYTQKDSPLCVGHEPLGTKGAELSPIGKLRAATEQVGNSNNLLGTEAPVSQSTKLHTTACAKLILLCFVFSLEPSGRCPLWGLRFCASEWNGTIGILESCLCMCACMW